MLQTVQQNVEIPEIVLSFHPAISAAIVSAQSSGHRPTVESIESGLLGDTAFLNKLQGEVNSWIKEIQNVTKLNRDVASGTASQEVNFWLSMEKALESIEEQLKSEPIVLTLDILRHAKRFHATVSFIADTGLKEATDVGAFLFRCGYRKPSLLKSSLPYSAQVQPTHEGLPTQRAPRRD